MHLFNFHIKKNSDTPQKQDIAILLSETAVIQPTTRQKKMLHAE